MHRNASTPAINNSTLVVDTPLLAVRIPNLAIATAPAPVSSNPKVTLPIAPTNVTIPRNSNLLATLM